MGQTREGAAKAKLTMIKGYMEEYGVTETEAWELYRKAQKARASMGGKISKGGPFTDRAFASEQGRKGGQASRRRKSES